MKIMRIAKSLVPEAAMRRMREARVIRNRSRIRKKSEQQTHLCLSPVNRVEHYFHCIFDLILPLHCVLQELDDGATVSIPEFGIFSDRIPQIFGPQVAICEREEFPHSEALPLLGMNPQFTRFELADLISLKRRLLDAFDIDHETRANKVLLIERLPPNEYFTSHAVKKGAGASRRSIPNHEELRQSLEATIPNEFEFHNVRLEELEFRDQVELFHSAAAIIGQHGAGLANCAWMRQAQLVLEITHRPELQHFQRLSHLMKHEHVLHISDGSHAPLNIPQLINMWTQALAKMPAKN